MNLKNIKNNLAIFHINLFRNILSFCIPLLIFVFAFESAQVYLGGENTILTSELKNQYIDFLSFFRNTLANGDNIQYTFSSVLGSDAGTILAYYLLSPFNLLVFFFPAAKISSAVYLIIALKIAMAGFLFNIYICHHIRTHRFYTLAFSTAYAVSGYIFFAFYQIMWLDAIYMLPLIAYYIDKLIREKRRSRFPLCLGLAVIMNFSCGYILWVASLLYFIYMWISESQKKFLDLFCFILGTISAALLSMIVLLPTFLGYGKQFISPGSNLGSMRLVTTVPQFIATFFTGNSAPAALTLHAPQIYIGIVPLVFFITYLLCKRPVKEKIVSIIIVLLFAASFIFDSFSLMWSAFSSNITMNFKYAFVFVFFALTFGSIAFEMTIRDANLYKLVLVSSCLTLALGACYYLTQAGQVNNMILLFDCASILVVAGNSVRKDLVSRRLNLTEAILIFELIALLINGSMAVSSYSFDDNSYSFQLAELSTLTENVKAVDSGMYRTEDLAAYSANDSLSASYYGLSGNSICLNENTRTFMKHLGYSTSNQSVKYDFGGTLAGDSLLGIKYLYSDAGSNPSQLITLGKFADVGSKTINVNHSALELGTMVSSKILSNKDIYSNPFEYQEWIYSSLLGREANLFTDCEQTDLVYEKDRISFSFTAHSSEPVMMYIQAEQDAACDVYVNGKLVCEQYNNEHNGILPLGCFEQTAKVDLMFNGPFSLKQIKICSENLDSFITAANALKKNGWQVANHTNTVIEANVNANDESRVLFTTIPYDDGWKATIDGVEARKIKVLDSLLAVEIPDGTHTVSLTYNSPYIREGVIFSLIGLFIIMCIALWDLHTRDNLFVINFNLIESELDKIDDPAKESNVEILSQDAAEGSARGLYIADVNESTLSNMHDMESLNGACFITVNLETYYDISSGKIIADSMLPTIEMVHNLSPESVIIIHSVLPVGMLSQIKDICSANHLFYIPKMQEDYYIAAMANSADKADSFTEYTEHMTNNSKIDIQIKLMEADKAEQFAALALEYSTLEAQYEKDFEDFVEKKRLN